MTEPLQLDFDGNEVPMLPVLEPRGVRRGQRGGSTEAAKVIDRLDRFVDVLACFDLRGDKGATDDELAVRFPTVNSGTLCKRRLRLERAKLISETDERRATRFGVAAIVFTITDEGRRVLRECQT